MKPCSLAFQLAPQVAEVINLAIKDDCVSPIRSGHGLLARFEVDDTQPTMPQRDIVR